ncbi:redox-sensing transcriptional repressor Rex [Phragmitibacter flavus]|uniref:Redox-sensing transcriptional repressor Rex n=1 Tax=Phragmitibacter flavus TaxID=2576071 RepID=A0A5R8KHI5_9BACT|nr:redox-sensing transcriptional repressor Rex [Phragmitibacter flavus]
MHKTEIPRKTVYRLSIYQRCLQQLKDNHIDTVSSDALAKAAGVKSTQLRKDLTYFGQFGTRGLGYNVAALSSAISEVLGSSRLQPVILIGVGNLGSALLRYSGFQKEGFEIVAAFDAKPDPKRLHDPKIPLLDAHRLTGYIRQHQIKMAILTVPAQHAQEVVNGMVEAGIQAVLNFSPVILEVPKSVIVNNVDLAVELENLSYFIR